MKILLAQNSLYYPAHGGGDKSNRLLLEALAGLGHQCHALARISVFGDDSHREYLDQLASRGITPTTANGVVRFSRNTVDVSVVTNANLRAEFVRIIETFAPDIILT